MRTAQGNLRAAIFVAAAALSGCKNIPSQVHEVVFETSAFSAPIAVDPGREDGESAVESAKHNRVVTGILPPIILTEYNNSDKQLLSFLVKNGYSRVECIPRVSAGNFGGSHASTYCYIVHNAKVANLKHIAVRKLSAITYSNKYNATILGTPVTVMALTFKYTIDVSDKSFPPVDQVFEGGAKVVLNPDTGRWQLDQLSVTDKGSAIFADYIHTKYEPYTQPSVVTAPSEQSPNDVSSNSPAKTNTVPQAANPQKSATPASKYKQGLIRSADGGRTWEQVVRTAVGVTRVLQGDTLLTADYSTLSTMQQTSELSFLRSTDDGLHWKTFRIRVNWNRPRCDFLEVVSGGRVLASGFFYGTLSSSDNGTTWTMLESPVPPYQINLLGPDANGRLLATKYPSSSDLQTFAEDVRTWIPERAQSDDGKPLGNINGLSTVAGLSVLSTSKGIYTRREAKGVWSSVGLPKTTYRILHARDGGLYAYGAWGEEGIFYSADGIGWNRISGPELRKGAHVFICEDHKRLILLGEGADGSAVYLSDDRGKSWVMNRLPKLDPAFVPRDLIVTAKGTILVSLLYTL
jgi:photosystem II stability/assembly factor-like uncharacterized protein